MKSSSFFPLKMETVIRQVRHVSNVTLSSCQTNSFEQKIIRQESITEFFARFFAHPSAQGRAKAIPTISGKKRDVLKNYLDWFSLCS